MSRSSPGTYLALSGGVGGAKLALGLSKTLAADRLTIVANTGDDFTHLGLRVCPDLDTVVYTLADLSNRETGWGLAGESWDFLAALETLGGESWFRLGDRDLATHVMRTEWLREGSTLTEVTARICARFGIAQRIVPMSDDPVATMVHVVDGTTLAFQHYFVRDRCEPRVTGFHFDGIEGAAPNPAVEDLLASGELAGIVVCPSNPFVSVDPILMTGDLGSSFRASDAPVVAVSPIVGGQAIKGPAAKMMAELGMPASAAAVAEYYGELLDGFVLDERDAEMAAAVEALGIPTTVTNTVMVTLADRVRLAEEVLAFIARL